MSGRPKALLLDLGNVTVRLRFDPFYAGLAAACGRPPGGPADPFADPALRHADYERGVLGARAWHALLAERLGLRLDFPRWLELWNGVFEPNAAMDALLRDLRGQVRLWGLSNTNPEHLARLRETCPVLATFEGITTSFETGARKPEEAIYRAALAALGLDPGEVLYLDDVGEYVAAGRSMGLGTFHYTFNDAQLRRHMAELGFAVRPPDGGAPEDKKVPFWPRIP